MIDDSDGDFAALASMGAGPILGIILIGLAVFFWYQASKNRDECAQRTCPAGMVGKLLDHQCLCVAPPKEGTQ